MSFFLKSLAAGVFTIASFSVGATTAPVLDTTPQMAYEDISRSLTELQPITFQWSGKI
jgi:thiol:disulfide interchange protein DsbC